MIQIQFQIEGPDLDLLNQRNLNKIDREGSKAALEWLQKRLPSRFDGSMQGVLKFKTRSRSWNRTKGKIKAGTSGKAHLFTGRTRRQALNHSRVKPGGKRKQLIIEGLNPGYGRKRRRGNYPNMRDELTRVAGREAQAMASIYKSVATAELRRLLKSKRKRERVG